MCCEHGPAGAGRAGTRASRRVWSAWSAAASAPPKAPSLGRTALPGKNVVSVPGFPGGNVVSVPRFLVSVPRFHQVSGSAETKGTLSAEEDDEQIGVGVGPVNLSAPFNLDGGVGSFNGNDMVCSVSDGSKLAHVDDRIYLTGNVASRASTDEAAKKSEITVQIIPDEFSLVFTD